MQFSLAWGLTEQCENDISTHIQATDRLNITQLEMLNVLIALRTFGEVRAIRGKVKVLLNYAYEILNRALHPRTGIAYLAKFKLFMAFKNYQFYQFHIDAHIILRWFNSSLF